LRVTPRITSAQGSPHHSQHAHRSTYACYHQASMAAIPLPRANKLCAGCPSVMAAWLLQVVAGPCAPASAPEL